MASVASVVVLIPSTGEVGGTWGSTGATATRKLHGLSDQSFTITERTEAVPMVGYYGASPVNDEVQQAGEFSMEGVVTYQEMPKIYNGLFTYTSASTAAADPYDYYWSAPVASTQACATYGLEFGTTGQPYVARGSIFNGLRISGEAGSNWKFSVDGLSKQILVSSGLSTAAFADSRSMKPVPMKETNIRLVPHATGVFGSSSGQISATLISFELNYNPNRHLKFFAGSKEAGNWGDNRNEATLRTLLEFNTTAKAYVDELLASSTSTSSTGVPLQKQIRLWASSTSTAGTTGFAASIDFAGIVSSPIRMWENRDGNLTVSLEWAGKFSTAFAPVGSTNGNYLSFQIVNGSSSTT